MKMKTFEDKLKHADDMAKKLEVPVKTASPHPPQKPWVAEKQKQNPWYSVIFPKGESK